jgi:VWFA-related protein
LTKKPALLTEAGRLDSLTKGLFIFSVLFLCAACALAQQSQEGLANLFDLEQGPVPDGTQGILHLDVQVQDKSGRPTIGLQQRDFTFQDNGQPGKIVSFQAFNGVAARYDPSVEVILVIDELNTTTPGQLPRLTPQLLSAQAAAEKFLRQHQGNLDQPVCVYRLTKDGLWTSGQPSFSGNRMADEIARANRLQNVWKTPTVVKKAPRLSWEKDTNFNLSLSLVALGSIAIEERYRPGRKLVFWLSPGWQIDGPEPSDFLDLYIELSTRLREARMALWQTMESSPLGARDDASLTTNLIRKEYRDRSQQGLRFFTFLRLSVFAMQSGGGVLQPNKDMSDAISERIDQESHFYSLTFDPPFSGLVDEIRDLRIQIDKPDLTAYTQTLYFDEPGFYDQPNPKTEFVTVAQLKGALEDPDVSLGTQLARRLSGMELTERLNGTKAAEMQSAIIDNNVRQAFIALADRSVFLDLPASEILAVAPPGADMQRLIVSKALKYVQASFPKMPDFFADRTTLSYQEIDEQPDQSWKTATGDRFLHTGETLGATVVFRDGKEVLTKKVAKNKQSKAGTLDTYGTFGPILAIAMLGATAPQSDLTWSHWENGNSKPQAVFRYHARPQQPIFKVGSEFLTQDGTVIPFEKNVFFHGELAIDPESGAILRLTMQSDIGPRLPLDQSDIMVEYGPVMIGGVTYICPLKSVSISRQRRIIEIQEWAERFKVYGSFETLLNDTTFKNYHLFHSTVRMLPGSSQAPGSK